MTLQDDWDAEVQRAGATLDDPAPEREPLPPEVTDVFEDFWRSIIMPGGKLDLDQVKRELHDYHHLLEAVPRVYMHITHGRISKPNTTAYAVMSVHDEVCPAAAHEEPIRLVRAALNEIGVPGDDTPAPIANAVQFLADALYEMGVVE